MKKEHNEAEQRLYRDMESDVVSSSQLQSDLKRIGELKAQISALHFKAVLHAINVLDHRQHLRARELLKLRLEMWRREPHRDET
jgi:hypothetical protein